MLAPVETPSPKQRGCARTTGIFVGRARASGAPLLDHPERSIGDVARIAPPALVTKGTNSTLIDRRLVDMGSERAAWFKDPEGNLLSVWKKPKA